MVDSADDEIRLLEGTSYVFQMGSWSGLPGPSFTYSYRTDPGTANLNDFVSISGSGESDGLGLISIVITTKNDTVLEPNEVFYFSINGSFFTDGQEAPFIDGETITIIDDDKLTCRFDVDGNGSIDNVELGYSEAWAVIDKIDIKQELYKDELLILNERIEGLKTEAEATGLVAKASLVKYLTQVASLGSINTIAELVPSISSISASAYNVLFQGQSTEAAVKDAWLDVLDVLNDLAKSPLKALPMLSLIKNTADAFNDAESFMKELVAIQDNIKLINGRISDTSQKNSEAQIARDQVIKCLSDGSDQKSSGFSSSVDNSPIALASNSALVHSQLSPAENNGKSEIFAFRNESMPVDMYIATGSALSDLIHARPDIANFGDATVMVSTGDGDDVIAVSKGAIYIDNERGNDSVVFQNETGGLISARQITYANFMQNSDAAMFGIRDDLVVGTRGVEKFSFLEGTFNASVDSDTARVFRMYDAAFDRAPDGYGFNGWVSRLDTGMNIREVAAGFMNSEEFQQVYGNASDDDFVERLYLNILGRASDAAGKANWINQISSGNLDRAAVLANFSESAEHIEITRADVERGLWDIDEEAAMATRLYSAALNRKADDDGLQVWTNVLKNGANISDVADGFTNSQEFQNLYGQMGNDDFVESMYINILNRSSDVEGKQSWTNALNEGRLDRSDVVLGFSDSVEYQIKTISLIDYGFMLA